MTENPPKARPSYEHVTAVRARLLQQRWSWIAWWNAEGSDQEGEVRQSRSATPASVIADVLEAAAELGLLAGDERQVLARLAHAAKHCLHTHIDPEPNKARVALQRGELGMALSNAWAILRPDEAGTGSDEDAPSARQERPQVAAQADPVAQYPSTPENRSEAVPQPADAPSEVGPSEPTSNSDATPVGALPALDRALALLHDLADPGWEPIPGNAAYQVRVLDTAQLAEWRQRMAAIEEAAG